MAQTSNEFVTRLAAISQDLADLVRTLEGEMPAESAEFPAWAAEKMAKGICLECDLPIGDDPQARRGLHSRCYLKARETMRQRRLTEATLIVNGVLAPRGKPGRKAGAEKSRIDELLAAVDERPIEAIGPILDAAQELKSEERRDKARDRRKKTPRK